MVQVVQIGGTDFGGNAGGEPRGECWKCDLGLRRKWDGTARGTQGRDLWGDFFRGLHAECWMGKLVETARKVDGKARGMPRRRAKNIQKAYFAKNFHFFRLLPLT